MKSRVLVLLLRHRKLGGLSLLAAKLKGKPAGMN